mmetsp:Transcript_22829/g.48101  ORF Transcript_22829/g.48101 Transcript_22829/m.48101 type:complete len:81 (-) Transcript_22829:309-551(-)
MSKEKERKEDSDRSDHLFLCDVGFSRVPSPHAQALSYIVGVMMPYSARCKHRELSQFQLVSYAPSPIEASLYAWLLESLY